MNKALTVLQQVWQVLASPKLADLYLYGGVAVLVLSIMYLHGLLFTIIFAVSMLMIIRGALLGPAPKKKDTKTHGKQKIIDVEAKE